MLEIRHLLTIEATPRNVYRAITEQEGVQGWWTSGARIKPEIGSIAVFDFGDRYHNEMRILQLKEDQLVKWECLEGDPEWIGTRYSFDLEADSINTILRFSHSDWREMTDFFASCNYQWGYYLQSLKIFCETGEGTPFQEVMR